MISTRKPNTSLELSTALLTVSVQRDYIARIADLCADTAVQAAVTNTQVTNMDVIQICVHLAEQLNFVAEQLADIQDDLNAFIGSQK